jgi:hypothetical protein
VGGRDAETAPEDADLMMLAFGPSQR